MQVQQRGTRCIPIASCSADLRLQLSRQLPGRRFCGGRRGAQLRHRAVLLGATRRCRLLSGGQRSARLTSHRLKLAAARYCHAFGRLRGRGARLRQVGVDTVALKRVNNWG